MKLITKALASTSIVALSVTAASADDNKAYLLQQGNAHSALVTQDGNNNLAGRSNGAMKQINEFSPTGNTLTIDQDGDNNAVGTGAIVNTGTGVFQKNQSSIGAIATVTQDSSGVGNANGNEVGTLFQQQHQTRQTNTVGTITQTGDDNEVTAFYQRADGSTDGTTPGRIGHTGSISQTGMNNLVALFYQRGANQEASISITGDDNGRGALMGASAVASVSNSSLEQLGHSNRLDFTISNGNNNQFGFYQNGGENKAQNLSISGDGNKLGISQIGDKNSVDLTAISGNGNNVGLTQNGFMNTAKADIQNSGNDNEFGISQYGATNDASVMVDGDSNGATASGGLFGVAGSLGLTSGLVAQWGDDNFATLTITGDNNAFALEQGTNGVNGNDNSITGTVTGNNNAAAVAQGGHTNVAVFTQNGNGNSAGISQ